MNDEGFQIRGVMYCGRLLGEKAVPGKDGQCGPSSGPQCASCKRGPKDKLAIA